MNRRTYPQEFIDHIKRLLPKEFVDFFTALAEPAGTSIQLNARKIYKALGKEHSVLWYQGGRYLEERPVFTLDPLLHAGAYYVQEASSMLIGAAIQQYIKEGQAIRALDLCAAPGGKSLLVGGLLSQKSIIVSNEIIRNRLTVLRENIAKKGYNNYVIGNFDANSISNGLPEYFDLVLVDAPCSGEGLFRKNPGAIDEWSVENVKHCSLRQRRILGDIIEALAPGGILLYSTCTYNDQEDKQNAEWLAQKFQLKPLSLQLDDSWGVVERKFQQSFGYYCFPHKVKGEGFFLSIFQKPGEPSAWPQPGKKQQQFRRLSPLEKSLVPELAKWIHQADRFSWFTSPKGQVIGIPKDLREGFLYLDHQLPGSQFGLLAGEFKGKTFIPSPELALSVDVSPHVTGVDLDLNQALAFLRKEPLQPENWPLGWVLAKYEGLGLGWMKVLPNRVNNYWPTKWRVLMK